MERKWIMVFLLFLLAPVFVKAQDDVVMSERKIKKLWREADGYLEVENYRKAIEGYNVVLQYHSDCALLHFKLGLSYFELKKYPLALKFFLTAQGLTDSGTDEDCNPPEILYYLTARTYYFNDQPDSALVQYEKIAKKAANQHDIKTLEIIREQKELCEQFIEFAKDRLDIRITNLGSVINSEFVEHSPVINAVENTLIFTSKRFSSATSFRDENNEYYEDIYITHKVGGEWETPVGISPQINTSNHDASVALSADGKELIIYRPEENGSLFVSKFDGKVWTAPTKLNSHINTSARETSACLSPDGKLLYFTSDRSGGFGGQDIYVSRRTETGSWGLAKNLGANINTPEDEIGPFIHSDNHTLYFSSKGHNSLGGYDIFVSSRVDSVWTEPMSLGAPINSPRDDVFFVLSANGLHAYFSSFKEDSYGETDLYRIDFQQPAQIQYMYVRGTIEVCENQVIPHIDIIATNTKTLEIAGVYVPNIRTGKFFMALSPDNSYDISFDYQGDVFKEDKLVFNENSDQSHYLGFIQLPFLQCQKTRAYKNLSAGKLLTRIYFSGVYYDIARNTDLDNLANYLLLHAESTIGLTSYTTTNGIKPDLYELATKRLKSVKLYLLNKGVLESQLKTNIAGPSSSLSQFVGSENYDDRVEIHILDDSGTKLELIWTDPVNYGYEKP